MKNVSLVSVCLIACVATAPSPSSIADCQADVASAQKAVQAARRAFSLRLPQSAEYQSAKNKVDEATSNLDQVRSAGRSDEIAQAASAKLKAQSNFNEVVKKLELADKDERNALAVLSNANDRLEKAKLDARKIEESRRADSAKAKKLADEAARSLKQSRRAEYMGMVNAERPINARPGPLPLVGDEADLPLVSANPQRNIDKELIVTGCVRISDYYNFAYLYAKPTHYSFEFRPATKSGQFGSAVTLYQKKSLGDDILNVQARISKDDPRRVLFLRLKVTLSSRYIRTFDDSQDMFEVLDWQFHEAGDKWTPWHSEIDTAN